MKCFVVFASIIAVCLASQATIIHPSEVTEDLIKDPRFYLYERKDGLIEVEDLYNTSSQASSQPRLRASENEVTFYIFTPENRRTGVQLRKSQLHNIVRLTGFDVRRETLVVIHGWKNHYESPVNDYIKNAVLKSKNVNVIVADWSPISSRNYLSAQGAVLRVGNFIGDFLKKLDDELHHRLKRVTIVGHSLGAHVAGCAGARTHGLINTIVGLDPAGPLFTAENTNNRLDPTDAGYVQVIHTNDLILGFGIKMGHADFYPNGGSGQPGCGLDVTGSCAHSRAYEYYAESLNSNKFAARKCTGWTEFLTLQCMFAESANLGGMPVQRASTGDYYLRTNGESLYARG